MKERLKNLLESTNLLSNAEISKGLDYFEFKTFRKGEILIGAGKVCNWMAFVNQGVLRNFYISSKGEEVTYCLTFPLKVVSAFSSFMTQNATFENIHALTDGDLLVINRTQYYELMDSNENWLKFSRLVAEQSYIAMENRLLALQIESAKKRYMDLISSDPEIIQEVPLKYLSSYLGITPRHLSRLRKEVS